MADFLMLMKGGETTTGWDTYIERLVATGLFRGGSALGHGASLTKAGAVQPCEVTGFMRFEADDINAVKALVAGNPVFEAGGTVDVLELIES